MSGLFRRVFSIGAIALAILSAPFLMPAAQAWGRAAASSPPVSVDWGAAKEVAQRLERVLARRQDVPAAQSAAIYIEPDAGIAPVVSVIDGASSAVDLNAYYISSKPIIEALRRAVERGVKVRVLLDQKPYGIHDDMVIREARDVTRAGAVLRWAPQRFTKGAFNHAKYVCSETTCAIGTANFSQAAFTKNREYIVVSSQPQLVQAARSVFEADWNDQQAPASAHKVLVLSPGAEETLLSLIRQPGPIRIETEELGNAPNILHALAQKGSDVRLILPDSISASSRKNAQWLAEHGVQVRLMPKRVAYMHAKMIINRDTVFIGSQNFSQTSLERNREMGVLLPVADAKSLQQQFEIDWNASQPLG